MAKTIKIYGYPKMGVHTDQQKRIAWAKESALIWTLEDFMSELKNNKFMIDAFEYNFFEEEQNSHDITINIVELATTLAHEKTKEYMISNGEITDEDGMWRLEQDSEEDGSGESYGYMPEAQIYFDKYYDEFYSIIEESKIK